MTPEERAHADLTLDGLELGLELAEVEAYADAMLATLYGRHLVLAYAVADVRAEVAASWPGRALRRLVRRG